MTRHDGSRPEPLAEEIRRLLGSPGMTRYLSGLPDFSVEPGLPKRLSDLLGNLKRAERSWRGGRGRRRG